MSNRIVLVNQSTRHLMIDIANAYADKYDEVVLFEGVVEEYERPLDKRVKRVKIMTYNRSSGAKRMVTWGVAFLQILFKLLFGYRGYKVLYFTNPPIAYFAQLFLKKRFSIVVYDIYPDALRNVGVKETSFIYRKWTKINKRIFAKSERIITLGEGMADVLSQYVGREKIKVIPNWSFTEKFVPIPKINNPFAKEHKLEDKFVVMYSGNMGYTHSVDVLLDAAGETKNDARIHYLMIGQGKKKPLLEERVKNENLTNVTILDLQPFDVVPYSFAAADVAMITLNAESGAVSVPGKTYDLLSAGAPLLCICPETSEMVSLTKEYENGKCFRAEDVKGVVDFIKELAANSDLQKKMSDNSLKASKNFTYHNAENYVI